MVLLVCQFILPAFLDPHHDSDSTFFDSELDPECKTLEVPVPKATSSSRLRLTSAERLSAKTVIHSMGPKLDEKFLAALDSWHFHPATHNGTAIPSKQDAIFHFRARG
jgi:hypothetical protein